jgi:Flp pilus assembly protein CpaB
MGFIIYTYRSAEQSYEGSRTVEVVVAKTNLVAGAVLGYDNLGVKRFTQSKLQTKDYVIEDHGFVLIGHRINKPLEINEPLTWHNTDIVITNKVGR